MASVRLGGVKQVAAILGVSTPTVWRMAKARALPASLKVGRRTLWRLDAVELWIEEQTYLQAQIASGRRCPSAAAKCDRSNIIVRSSSDGGQP